MARRIVVSNFTRLLLVRCVVAIFFRPSVSAISAAIASTVRPPVSNLQRRFQSTLRRRACVKFAKLLPAAEQRTLGPGLAGLLAAALPQFFHRSVQKHRWHAGAFSKRRVLVLHEGSAAQGDDSGASAAQFLEHLLQRGMLGPPELGFSRVPENLRHGAPFARLDAVVEIFKEPIQPLPQGAAHTAFPSSHEADQENGVPRKTNEATGTPVVAAPEGAALRSPFCQNPSSKVRF